MTTVRTRLHGAVAIVLGATVAAALCLVGTTGTAAADDAAPDIKVALTTDVDTFNPFLAILASSTGINRYVYEPLVGYGKENEPTEGLASEWDTSDDGTVWTFTIGDDREWSDGEPVTADDVVYTYTSIMEQEPLQQANGGLVANFEKVEATDDSTVTLTLKEPQASNPGQEIPIVPEHVWSKEDPTTYEADGDVVGSGPYTIESYSAGRSLRLEANPRFWRGAPKIAGITYVPYKSLDAAVQGLKSGEVDLLGDLTPAQYEALKKTDGISVNAGAGRRYQALAINPGAVDADGRPMGDGNPALKDPAVRKAIFMAIDDETLLDRVLDGLGTVGQTEIPTVYPEYFGFDDDTKPLEFDLDAANQVLDAAGYAKGDDGVRVGEDGKKLQLRLMGRNNDPNHAAMADFVKSWLQDIGIATTVSMVSPDQVNNDSTLGKYDLYFTSWGIGPDPDFQLSINTCDSRPEADGSGSTSENNWCSPEFDRLFAQQHAELDPDQRAGLVKQAFSTLYEAYVNHPIWYAQSLEAYRSEAFDGFTRVPDEKGPILGQNGYWGLYTAAPADGASSDDGGVPGWVLPTGIVVVLLAVGGGVLAARRRTPADDRE